MPLALGLIMLALAYDRSIRAQHLPSEMIKMPLSRYFIKGNCSPSENVYFFISFECGFGTEQNENVYELQNNFVF